MRKKFYLAPLSEVDEALPREALLDTSNAGLNDYEPKEWDWES